MKQQFKVAVIGCGYISPMHLKGYGKLPNVTLVAVCDLIVERAQQAKEPLKKLSVGYHLRF